jgi:hypothetical protein
MHHGYGDRLMVFTVDEVRWVCNRWLIQTGIVVLSRLIRNEFEAVYPQLVAPGPG